MEPFDAGTPDDTPRGEEPGPGEADAGSRPAARLGEGPELPNPQLTIMQRVDKLFESADPDSEWIRAFIDRVHEQKTLAEKDVSRGVFLFLVTWLAFYLIGAGLTSEGSLGPLTVSSIEYLVIAGPPILAVEAYLLAASTFRLLSLQDALSRSYLYGLPKAYHHDLELLVSAASFLGVEEMVARLRQGRTGTTIQTIFGYGIVLTIWFVPMIAVLQVVASMFSLALWPIWLMLAVTALAALVLVRATLVILAMVSV